MRGKIISYADDTCILFEHNSWAEVKELAQSELRIVKKWFDLNLLSVNESKSHFLPISLNSSQQPDFETLSCVGNSSSRKATSIFIHCISCVTITITINENHVGILFITICLWHCLLLIV